MRSFWPSTRASQQRSRPIRPRDPRIRTAEHTAVQACRIPSGSEFDAPFSRKMRGGNGHSQIRPRRVLASEPPILERGLTAPEHAKFERRRGRLIAWADSSIRHRVDHRGDHKALLATPREGALLDRYDADHVAAGEPDLPSTRTTGRPARTQRSRGRHSREHLSRNRRRRGDIPRGPSAREGVPGELRRAEARAKVNPEPRRSRGVCRSSR